MTKLGRVLRNRFPTYGERNVLVFYVASVFGSSMFMIANWLLFILLFMNERDFAMYESVAFGLGILVEVPSGAIADMLGKKRTVIVGYAMQAIGAAGFLLADAGVAIIFINQSLIPRPSGRGMQPFPAAACLAPA